MLLYIYYCFAHVFCRVHTLLLRTEGSTIVEGQRLGRHRLVHEHRHVHYTQTYTCFYTCACCGAESCRRASLLVGWVVGWVGGLVWCGDVVVSNCVLVVLSAFGELCRYAAFSCRGRLVGVVFSSWCRRFVVVVWWSLSEECSCFVR